MWTDIILAIIITLILGLAAYTFINEGDQVRTLPHRIKYRAKKFFRRP